MFDTHATVEAIETVAHHYRRLFLRTAWTEYVPGQFVMVRVPNEVVLVRRPFGIVDLQDGVLEICFKMVGRGTHELARCEVGDAVQVLGPLGHGFEPVHGATHILVAGGYGIAPLIGLACGLMCTGEKVIVYYGAKTAADLLYQYELEQTGVRVVRVTEDGSAGEKGYVSDAVARTLKDIKHPVLYCSGPEGLLHAVASLGARQKIPTQVSKDEYMACGIGVCLGCVCEMTDGTRQRACREGPVFDAMKIKWEG